MVHALISAFRLSSLEGQRLLQIFKPGQASLKDLSVYHSRDYLDYVLDAENSASSPDGLTEVTAEYGLEDVNLMNIHIISRNTHAENVQDCPPFKGLPEYVQLVAGASRSATNVLRQEKADIALCWDGGRSFFFLSLQDFR